MNDESLDYDYIILYSFSLGYRELLGVKYVCMKSVQSEANSQFGRQSLQNEKNIKMSGQII